jgi:hypothetical protein
MTLAANDPEGNPLTFSIAGGADASLFTLDSTTGALRFVFLPDFEAPADAGGNNLYDLIVAVSDGTNAPVTQTLSISVTDVENETGPVTSYLFGPGNQPATIVTNDPTDYELGTKFQADRNGSITELRYYRGAADAGDTDTRTLNLWDAAGNNLGSVTVSSAPGETGWQIGTLAAPIAVSGGATYVVSYGTVQNYAYTSNFFASEWNGPNGILSAPQAGIVGGNGVFSNGGTGLFPTASYVNSNYWVDVAFESIRNDAPAFTSPATASVSENTSAVMTLAANDPEGNALTYSIAGGADASLFTLDATTGALRFVFLPDFEAPADAGGNNLYDLIVAVSDGTNAPVTQTLSISVTDDENGPVTSYLFGPGNQPANIATDDPTDYELGTKFQTDRNGFITELRYYRGAADAGDTDARTLNLWDAAGNNLGSVTVSSAPGETGWQIGTLAAPIAVSGGATYVVSYGTVQNYAYTSNFFTQEWNGPDGIVTAPQGGIVGGNGVFAGGTGLFPTASFANSNYWVDVAFESTENDAPVFSGMDALSTTENSTFVGTIAATDADNNTLSFGIAGGDDASRFVIDPDTGSLSFGAAPDFELPSDANGDNVYEVVISASDGIAAAVERTYSVTVTNDPTEPDADTSVLFASNSPFATVVDDPGSYELGAKFQATTDGAISALRYYRGVEDSGDTDTRTLNLWDSLGNNLGSVTVVSDPGESGWQFGILAAPIGIDADDTYIVSYGTTQNYVYSPGFFDSDWVNADGILLAPAGASSGGNGVFGTVGALPTASYNNTNYWADVVFDHELFA